MIRTYAEIAADRITPLIETAPETGLSAPVADQGAEMHTRVGVDHAEGATGLSGAHPSAQRIRRKVDPDVGKARSRAVQSGLPDSVIEQYRHELHEANIVAAARKVAARMRELPPEKRACVTAEIGHEADVSDDLQETYPGSGIWE